VESDCCPNCLAPGERADHLCRCPNTKHTELLCNGTTELENWMRQADSTYHKILYWVPKYILYRGTIPFADFGLMSSRMMEAAISQDIIGWKEFHGGLATTLYLYNMHTFACLEPSYPSEHGLVGLCHIFCK
jgi:hypothetical protein